MRAKPFGHTRRLTLAAGIALGACLLVAPPRAAARAGTTMAPPSPGKDDPNYDPRKDPHHPLKDGTKDPGPGWARPPGDGTPPVRTGNGNWKWGELYYGHTYLTKLIVTNNCKTAQTATVFVHSPYITMPKKVLVRGKSKREVPVVITTPPEPPPPFVAPGQKAPPWGWVNPLPPGRNFTFAAEQQWLQHFHQPNFANIDGLAVVIWHPWRGDCFPRRITYHATGHIHFNPPPPKPSGNGGAQRAAAEPCVAWWFTGRPVESLFKMAGKKPEDCNETMHELATDYRTRIVQPHVDQAPADWKWLPSVDALSAMSIEDLLAMKKRADDQMAGVK